MGKVLKRLILVKDRNRSINGKSTKNTLSTLVWYPYISDHISLLICFYGMAFLYNKAVFYVCDEFFTKAGGLFGLELHPSPSGIVYIAIYFNI